MVRFKKQFDKIQNTHHYPLYQDRSNLQDPNENRYLVEPVQLYKVHRKHVHFFVKDFRRLVFSSTQYILCCLINFHLF